METSTSSFHVDRTTITGKQVALWCLQGLVSGLIASVVILGSMPEASASTSTACVYAPQDEVQLMWVVKD